MVSAYLIVFHYVVNAIRCLLYSFLHFCTKLTVCSVIIDLINLYIAGEKKNIAI